MNIVILQPKTTSETIQLTVPFSDRLQAGEVINGASVGISVFSGNDPSPGTVVATPPTYDSSGNLFQVVTGGVAGVMYTIAFLVTGSNAHNYVKIGQLAVLPEGDLY